MLSAVIMSVIPRTPLQSAIAMPIIAATPRLLLDAEPQLQPYMRQVALELPHCHSSQTGAEPVLQKSHEASVLPLPPASQSMGKAKASRWLPLFFTEH
jgi:hypothetical protein